MTVVGDFQPSCVMAAKLWGCGTSARSELTNCAMYLAQFINNCALLICVAQF